jgi:hypothetical protein
MREILTSGSTRGEGVVLWLASSPTLLLEAFGAQRARRRHDLHSGLLRHEAKNPGGRRRKGMLVMVTLRRDFASRPHPPKLSTFEPLTFSTLGQTLR